MHGQWNAEGLLFENCSCQVVCPGHFSFKQLCTYERCLGHWAIHFDKGHYGEVALKDLNVVIVFDAPQRMYDGGWTEVFYIDERADLAQREAIEAILSGQAGGPWQTLSRFVSTRLDARFVPIEFEDEGRRTTTGKCCCPTSLIKFMPQARSWPEARQNMPMGNSSSRWKAAMRRIPNSHGNSRLMPMQLTNSDSGQRRTSILLIASLAFLVLLFWVYTIRMAIHMHMPMPSSLAMPDMKPWSAEKLIMATGMWVVMMAAMMLPSVAPWVTALSDASARREKESFVATSVAGFIAGYLAIWSGYSVVAALAQAALSQQALLSPALVTTSPILGGALLIFAGGYQWTAAKSTCLNHCRSPVGYFLTSWRAGRWGGFQMGFKHGLYCVGCCWALMALSFVAGVMNLLWMMLITICIFIDHNLSVPTRFGKTAGVALIAWGAWMLALGFS
jgi:predicted metal-binding membrane protein